LLGAAVVNAPAGIRAPHSPPAARVNPLKVFIARAEARAQLWFNGEIDLHTAVDELWAAAVRDGLVAKLGADEVQQRLADTFAPFRDDLPRHEDVVPDPIGEDEDKGSNTTFISVDDEYDGLPSTFAKACREADAEQVLRAAEFLIRQKDPAKLRAWLSKYTAQECEALLQCLEWRKRARVK
jgi:hypothetical protein